MRGDIEWDDPLLVVDGKRYSWDQLGRMLISFEGFHVKLEVFDKSEER